MGLSATSKAALERIEHDIDTYPVVKGKPDASYLKLAAAAKALAKVIIEVCQEDQRRERALHKVEECIMWSHAALPDEAAK